jgi:hypothetical protein
VRVHELVVDGRQQARHDDLAGEITRLREHVVELRPVHRDQHRVRVRRRLARRARACVLAGIAGELLQLVRIARVAEHDVMTRPRPDRAELGAHQSRAEDPELHRVTVPRPTCPRCASR